MDCTLFETLNLIYELNNDSSQLYIFNNIPCKRARVFYIVSSSGTVSARKTVTNDTTLGVDKSECLMCDM